MWVDDVVPDKPGRKPLAHWNGGEASYGRENGDFFERAGPGPDR